MTAAIFLGGILAPARFRFIPLLAALGSPPDAVAKELELYIHGRIPDDYSLTMEIDGLDRIATEHGYERFHLYGYSIGAAIALAYVAAHGDRVISLALDEPATDFSTADRDQLAAENPENLANLPEDRRMQVFLRSLTRPDVVVTPPPATPPSAEMAMSPAGLAAVESAVQNFQVDATRLREFRARFTSATAASAMPGGSRWRTARRRPSPIAPWSDTKDYTT